MMSIAQRSIRGIMTRLSSNALAYSPLSTVQRPEPRIPASPATEILSVSPLAPTLNRLVAFLFFLLPSFAQDRIRPGKVDVASLHPTAWLDGVRGVACLLVFFCHYTEGTAPWLIRSYGVPDSDDDHMPFTPLQLPFLRVIFSGRPMVHVFFIISGFALSYKPLRLIRARDYDGVHRTLASSVFRRGFRLFMPTIASTFLVLVTIRAGWRDQPLPTLWEQLVDWSHAIWKITDSWNWDMVQGLPYDPHLWTIPVEMAMSMLLFAVLTGLSRVKTWVRLATLPCIMAYSLQSGHWAAFEFLAGMGLAEVTLIEDAQHERAAITVEIKQGSDLEGGTDSITTTQMPSVPTSIPRRIFQLFLVVNVVFALFVAGWPNKNGDKTPGISLLWRNTMEPFLGMGGPLVSFPWYTLGAVQIIVALQQIETLRKPFLTTPVQYLGRISFALYLCHGPVMRVLAGRCMPLIWGLFGGPDGAGVWSQMVAWAMGIIAMGIPVVWTSDVFWRSVDMKSVEFARWCESVCACEDINTPHRI